MHAIALRPKLRKSNFQLGLFAGNEEEVSLTPKAKQRDKQQKQWEQMGLFPATPKPAKLRPKRAKTALKPKAPAKGDRAHGARKTDEEGRTWFWNKPTGRWRLVRRDGETLPQPSQGGLKIIQDDPPPPQPESLPATEKPQLRVIRNETPQQLRPKSQPDSATTEKSRLRVVRDEETLEELFERADRIGSKYQEEDDPVDLSARRKANEIVDESGLGAIVHEGMGVSDLRLKRKSEPSEPSLEADINYKAVEGAKSRQQANQAAVELLTQKQSGFTQDELATLAEYSGKGGLGKDTESINEYFTRSDVAGFVVDRLREAGFSTGTVLEPSCGTGVFLGQLKGDDSVLPVGVEISQESAAIAGALNPHADVTHARFERFLLDNPDFQADGIVGNVPFGPRQISGDADLEAAKHRLKEWKDAADYFIDESMNRLKPNGVMSIIVPHGVVSGSQHQRLRSELVKKGRVVGVYRLPGEAFKHTGTNTVTDVLVVQKHPDPVLDAIARGDEAAIGAVADSSFVGGGYFDERPENILGEVNWKKRGNWGQTLEVKGRTEEALASAQPLSPSVTYEGLGDVAATPETGVPVGSVKFINGRQYRFEGDPPRWHRVDSQSEAVTEANPEAYGVSTLDEAHGAIADVGKRVEIHPDFLEAHHTLAQGSLSGHELEAMSQAAKAMREGKTTEQAKISHAVMLGAHLRQLKDRTADDHELRQALGMLMAYREKYGNPASDRTLQKLALDYPALLSLQGAFKDTGEVSDYFADPDTFRSQKQQAETVGAAAAEAYRSYGTRPVDLSQVREFYESGLPDAELKAKVLADPTIGYSEGLFMPIHALIRGDGFELLDTLQSQYDEAPSDSPESRKIQEQIEAVRVKMNLRSLEDMPINVWNVGSWIPHEAFNEFCAGVGIPLQVEPTEGGQFQTTKFIKDKKNKLNEGLLKVLNGDKIRAGTVAEKGYDMKEAISDFEADFKDWLAGTAYRDQIEDRYNRAFNARLGTEYSGEPLNIEGIDQKDGKRFHDFQCSTIRQMEENGRGIISLAVGLGKTATSIGLAMHLKEVGRATKNGIVVPKSVMANWVKEIKFWAPNANVMVLGMSQRHWADGSEAYEMPGFQIAMEGEKPQAFRDGTPRLKPVGDLAGLILETTGRGAKQAYRRDKQGNYLLYSEDDADLPPKQREYIAVSPDDLERQAVPIFSGGAGSPEKDAEGNFILYADSDRARQNPIAMSPGELQKKGLLAMVTDDAATKERKMQQTAQNAFDIVLMSEPVCQRINLSPEQYKDYLEDTVGRHLNPESGDSKRALTAAHKRVAEEGPREGDIRENRAGHLEEFRNGRWHLLSKDEEKSGYAKLKQQEQAMAGLLARQGEKTQNIYWEDLGIDNLIADEAHHYKNLFAPFRSDSEIAFVSSAQSNRALDFYFKAKHTLDSNNGQNVYALTATPTSNNPLEIYNMLQHVCPDELDARGIHNVDQFLQHFGRIEEVQTMNVKLEVTTKNGLVGFEALNDLRKLTDQYVRMESAESLQAKGNTSFRQPEKGIVTHTAQMTSKQREIYEHLKARAQELEEKRKRGEEHEEGDDHIFSIISDMDKVALDINFYEERRSQHAISADLKTAKDKRSPKVEQCVQQVMASRAGNQGKQIVFCDAVVMHDALKDALVKAGYPENEIAIVNAGTMPNSSDRQRISQAYNSGRISLVIGNTATMGEGMNFQIGTTDIHHLNLPWTPAALEQRDGRGVRQGNTQESVSTHYYLADGSFDAYRQDTLARKAGWQEEIWHGDKDSADNLNAVMAQEDDIGIMLASDPQEAARKRAESKEAAAQKKLIEGRKSSMRQFESLQNKKKIYLAMTPSERTSEKGRGMLADINRTTKRLSENPYFEHKALLESPDPVYIHKNRKLGTQGLLAVGDHIKDSTQYGSTIYKVNGIDLGKNEVTVTEVARSSYDVMALNPGREQVLSLKHFAADGRELAEKQSKVGGRGWDKERAQGKYFTPFEYNDEIHRDRILKKGPTYQMLRSLDPTWVDENRELVTQSIRDNNPYGPEKYVYLDEFEGYKTATTRSLPEKASVIMPGDGDHVEGMLRELAQLDLKADYESRSELNTAFRELTGQDPNRRGHYKDKVEQYRTEIVAAQQSGPVEGTTRVNSAGHLEILKDGRWRLANPEDLTRDSAMQLADGVIADTPLDRYYGASEVKLIIGRALFYAGKGDRSELDGLETSLTERLKYARVGAGDEDKAREIKAIVQAAERVASGPPEGAEVEPTPLPQPEPIETAVQPDPTELPPVEPSAIAEQPEPDSAATESQKNPLPADPAQPLETHPDPIGAITQALAILHGEDPDGASERNGVGFNGFHTPRNNEFVASLVGREHLTDKQLLGALSVVHTYHKRLGKEHGITLPTKEQLEQAIASRPVVKKPIEQKSSREIAADIVEALSESDAHDYTPGLWDRRGMRIYLNEGGERRSGPGFIEINSDGTIENKTSLDDSHPVFQIASTQSLGLKALEAKNLPDNPTREDFAEYLSGQLNNHPDIDLKSQVWSKGKRVRVYINTPGSRNGPSGRPEYLDITVKGITDYTSLPSDHLLITQARTIHDEVRSQHGPLQKGLLYCLGGTSYILDDSKLVRSDVV